MDILYRTSATVTGGRTGHGRSEDGLLDVELQTAKELGGAGGGTNPEQLFGVGYAACFLGAIRFVASVSGKPASAWSVALSQVSQRTGSPPGPGRSRTMSWSTA